jgi:peptide/nickel transport system substrate-binding protein
MAMRGRTTRVSAVLAVGGFLAATMAACTSSGSSSSGSSGTTGSGALPILKYGSSTTPASLDPRQSASFDPIFLIPAYDSLIKRDAKGALQPDLATSWTLAEDAKSLAFTLRSGVKFQDGTPFDADAVKANIDADRKPGNTTTSPLAPITAVTVSDPTHVTVAFSRPSAQLVETFAGEAGMMISPKALGNSDLATKPVGTGPFQVTSYTQAGIKYRLWDGYWDKSRIKIGGIDMTFLLDDATRAKAVETGQVQLAFVRPQQQDEVKAAGLSVTTGAAAFMYAFWLNTAHKPFDNPLVRQALLHAIDRKEIDTGAFDGGCQPLVQPFPPGYWANVPGLEDSDAAKYDPALAKRLLAQAGLPNGFSFTLLAGTAAAFHQAQQIMQAQLKKIGVTMTIQAMDNTAVSAARREGKFAASFASIQSGRPDPSTFLVNYYLPDGVSNPGHYQPPNISADIDALQKTADSAKRKAPMADAITKVLQSGPPIQPLCSATVVWAHNDKVKGVEVPINYDYDLTKISLS